MLDLSYIIQDMKDTINTTAAEFKIVDDVKNEPTFKEAQEFVGGYLRVSLSLMEIIL